MTCSTLTPIELESPQIVLQRFVESLEYDRDRCTRVFIDPDVASSLGITAPDGCSLFGTRVGTVSPTKFGCVEWTCKGFESPDCGYVCPLTHYTFGEAELALEVIFCRENDAEQLVQIDTPALKSSQLDRWQRSHWYGQSFDREDYRDG